MPAPTPAVPDKSRPDGAEENPELIRFREEWLAELRKQGKVLRAGAAAQEASTVTSKEGNAPEPAALPLHSPEPSTYQPPVPHVSEITPTSQLAAKVATHPAVKNGEIVKQFPASKVVQNALEVYRRAIEHEQRGELDDALLLYRQAFRLVCPAPRYVDASPAQMKHPSRMTTWTVLTIASRCSSPL